MPWQMRNLAMADYIDHDIYHTYHLHQSYELYRLNLHFHDSNKWRVLDMTDLCR